MIARSNDMVIIYEAGVLVLNQDLDITFHQQKISMTFSTPCTMIPFNSSAIMMLNIPWTCQATKLH
jgi:hypothetical protein